MTSLKTENAFLDNLKLMTFRRFASSLLGWLDTHTQQLYIEPGHTTLPRAINEADLKNQVKRIQAIYKIQSENDELALRRMLRTFSVLHSETSDLPNSVLPAFTPYFADIDTYQININRSSAYRSIKITADDGWLPLTEISMEIKSDEQLEELNQKAVIASELLFKAGYRTKRHKAYKTDSGIGYATLEIATEDLIAVNKCDFVQKRELSGLQYRSQQLRHEKETLRGRLGLMLIPANQDVSIYQSIPRSRRSDSLIGKAGKDFLIEFPVETHATYYKKFK